MDVRSCFFGLICVLLLCESLTYSSYYSGESNKRRHRYKRRGSKQDWKKDWKRNWKPRQRYSSSKVILASGNTAYITDPVAQKSFKCSDKSRFVNLDPNGSKWSKKEFNIVKNELESTWGFGQNFAGNTIVSIQKIENPCLWSKYQHRMKEITQEAKTANEYLLFHGSSAAVDIAETGFDERYARISGAFGAGLYFASHSAKSKAYSPRRADGTSVLLMCRVSLGRMAVVRTTVNYAHAPPGYHSVKGDVDHPEFVVYRGEQVYPAYVIIYK